MSQLGDLVRLPARLRAEIVADRRTAYDRMTGQFDVPERLELDWEWRPFRDLMELAGTLDGDPTSPTYLRELPPERWEPRRLSDDWIRDKHEQLAARYAELVEFYRAAAAGGECTVFWAA